MNPRQNRRLHALERLQIILAVIEGRESYEQIAARHYISKQAVAHYAAKYAAKSYRRKNK